MKQFVTKMAAAGKAGDVGSIPASASTDCPERPRFHRSPPAVTIWTLRNAARVAEQVDATDLKSVDWKRSCRFNSGLGHHKPR